MSILGIAAPLLLLAIFGAVACRSPEHQFLSGLDCIAPAHEPVFGGLHQQQWTYSGKRNFRAVARTAKRELLGKGWQFDEDNRWEHGTEFIVFSYHEPGTAATYNFVQIDKDVCAFRRPDGHVDMKHAAGWIRVTGTMESRPPAWPVRLARRLGLSWLEPRAPLEPAHSAPTPLPD